MRAWFLAPAAFLLAAACEAPAAASKAAAASAGVETTVAQSGAWNVDKAASRIEFSGVQAGAAFSGAFSNFDASIAFDPADLSKSNIKVVIDMASAKTGDRQRDAAMPTADWFSVKAHPTAIFTATKVEAVGEGAYVASGALSIRGVERSLDLPFTLAIVGERAVADGSIKLIRTDFDVGQGEFSTGQWVGLEVIVEIHVEAAR